MSRKIIPMVLLSISSAQNKVTNVKHQNQKKFTIEVGKMFNKFMNPLMHTIIFYSPTNGHRTKVLRVFKKNSLFTVR